MTIDFFLLLFGFSLTYSYLCKRKRNVIMKCNIIINKVKRWIKGVIPLCFLTFLPIHIVSQNYRPSGQAFVCSNGQNRYTRALYGSHTEWRVETSDRPVFALDHQQRTLHEGCQAVAGPHIPQAARFLGCER